jgi:hypothetical protein
MFFPFNNLQKARFFYEDSSWYDGTYWEKPFLTIKKDRFVITQEDERVNQQILRGGVFFLWFAIVFRLFFDLQYD